ncbi:MAG TPA: AlkA N-terminal domain-containing protein [Kofleriaceae bacterium]|nr:AlkA N-terminal domain-containing protein [Kofleriaceae bacterium]
MLTDDARYEAILARDPRFDGVFFVGVQTTGVYCRPICPARTPGRSRCTFYATPAQAEQAGFRACFRCRPELAPAGDSSPASVDAIDALVTTATQRIHEGALNTGSIDDLAAELGVTARHLRRATEARLGVSPIELAQTRRLALAKQLLQDTALPITSIAFAAGFGSVRRFNAMFAAKMGTPPNEIRRKHASGAGEAIELRLDYRPPYDWARLLGFLRGRAIPGVEKITDEYRRVVHLDGHVGEIVVRPDPRGARRSEHPNRDDGSPPTRPRSALVLELAPALLPVVMPLVARVRRMFDLDARPDLVDRALARDATLAPLVAARPGLRLPGAIDPFEASIRALLGQQVSVAAATTLAGRFAAQLGTKLGDQELCYRFPTPREVAKAGAERIVKIGMPMARANAIHNFARALDRGEIQLDHYADLDAFVAQLVELPGIGPWTAHYLAMRALHLPDAFPAADLGIQKALDRAGPRDAEARAAAWRPYRSYAVMHLWTDLSEGAAS